MNLNMNIYNLKQIQTPRLLIRPPKLGDEIELNKAINNSLEALQRWMPWAQDPSLETTRKFIESAVASWKPGQSQDFPMIVIHKADNKIICASGFNEHSDPTTPYYETGYWIDSQYQGQGLVSETANALTRFALDALKATRVQIRTQVENIKSIAVAERCGFECELTLQNVCIDCKSNLSADGYMFACCDINKLPKLEVSWQQKENNLESKPKPELKSKISSNQSNKTQISKNPKSMPTLETKRLKLIPPKKADASTLYKIIMRSLDELSPWFSWATKDLSIEHVLRETRIDAAAALDIKAHNELFYLVWDKDEKNILGEIWCNIKDWSVPYTAIGYWFDSSQTGKGYASEAVAELTRYAFNHLKCKRVYIEACEINQPSINLAKRLGFTHEGTLQNHARNFVTNKILATELFAMTNTNANLDQLNKDN